MRPVVILEGKADYPVNRDILAVTMNDPSLPDWERGLYAFLAEWISPGDFIRVKTSGSTGPAKNILHLKSRMEASARRSLAYFGLVEGQVLLQALPISNIAGMMMIVRAFVGRHRLLALPPQQLDLSGLQEKVDFSALVPLQVKRLLDRGGEISHIRKLIIGGAAVHPSLERELISRFEGQAWETYGMTETITHVACRLIHPDSPRNIFTAMPGVSFDTDDRGCLVIRDEISGGEPVVTNDLAELLSPGRFRLKGRFDNVINSGGIKISPEELEQKLAEHCQADLLVSSLPDEMLGEALVLVVKKGTALEEVRAANSLMENYLQARKIVEIDEIPRNINGKAQRDTVKTIIAKLR